eukprot:m51a1_g11161 hypothetical protein (95) ;mRNA; f:286366-286650
MALVGVYEALRARATTCEDMGGVASSLQVAGSSLRVTVEEAKLVQSSAEALRLSLQRRTEQFDQLVSSVRRCVRDAAGLSECAADAKGRRQGLH